MLFLTTEQHKAVLSRLVNLGERVANGVPIDASVQSKAYFPLMVSFLLHQLSAGQTLLRMSASFSDEWFPVTVGYVVARSMFEVDVTGHYISQSPSDRAQQYIDFAAILNKNAMDTCRRHMNSNKPDWRQAMDLLWQHHWSSREGAITARFDAVAPKFVKRSASGKTSYFNNWSGKTLRDIAVAVDHEEAYDIFYSELSSFTHADVHLADRFLKIRPEGVVWSQRAEEGDVGNVFRNAASFLTCGLELFATEFKAWSRDEVLACWKFNSTGLRLEPEIGYQA